MFLIDIHDLVNCLLIDSSCKSNKKSLTKRKHYPLFQVFNLFPSALKLQRHTMIAQAVFLFHFILLLLFFESVRDQAGPYVQYFIFLSLSYTWQ